ncbi:hypothetical protein Sste5346_008688 [Sporothrix stenoceras]|uniref:Uncharacterized protein n=1 Tax=Sporothrix stenoceras TaxID=5173 RepID=A0ABR3YMX5_9PEZI
MSSLFCCSSTRPYKATRLSHEEKFSAFMAWARYPQSESPTGDDILASYTPSFAIQLVKQVNFGPLESKRYFVPVEGNDTEFVEITEQALINANFQKLNAYKNFKCGPHNKFFEVNVYQKDPTNTHHWRADVARPAANIDL